ncbi:MAG: hypothetical protein IJU70_02080 [Lentisphaeria bacterium]|nr:hypothetical protein [Lentisphaeria bacterium]
MRKLLFSLSACGVLLSLTGCFFGGTTRETQVFDLAEKAKGAKPLPYDVHFLFFRNLSGSDRRFLLRQPGDRMVSDEFSRWLLDPELMLERYLRDEVRGGGSASVRIRGVITRFEVDVERRAAVLAVDFVLRIDDRSAGVSCRAQKALPAGGITPAGAAQAMSECASAVAEELRKHILAFAKGKLK